MRNIIKNVMMGITALPVYAPINTFSLRSIVQRKKSTTGVNSIRDINTQPVSVISPSSYMSKSTTTNSPVRLKSENSSIKVSRANRISTAIRRGRDLGVVKLDKTLFPGRAALDGLKSLGMEDKQARVILKKYPQLVLRFKDFEKKIALTLNFLVERQIPLKRIFIHPWLLFIQPEVLDQKVKEAMAILKIKEFEVALPFVNQAPSKLLDIASMWKIEAEREPALLKDNLRSRLEFLASILECQTTEVADMMAKVDILKTMSFQTLQTILMTLLDGGVRKVDIRSDPWIFENNVDMMIERLTKSRARGLSIIKPWILRSPLYKFESHVNRMITEEALLKGHKNVGSFLQQKLSCNKVTANEILFRVPSIKTASAIKLNEMIEFLYSKGFTADHIVETPRILGHSVETVASRTEELSKYGYQPYSLLVLCKTSKHYSVFIRRLQDSNKPHKKQEE